MTGRKTAAAPGWEAGYRAGWSEGFRLGKCASIVRQTGYEPSAMEVSVLYVKSGLWSYDPLDQGIIAALRRLVRNVHVAVPADDVAGLAAAVRPDLVLALNSVECLGVGQVDAIRGMGIRTAVWFTDDPYYSNVTGDIAVHYDDVFTLEEACVSFYQGRGCSRVHHLPFGANTAYYAPKRADPKYASDICFIGSAFQGRAALFDRIAPYLRDKSVFIAGYWWDRMANYAMLADKIRLGTWISPEETAMYYNSAKIVINLHRAIDDETNQNPLGIPARSVNPRSFEIGACAAFQLTDTREQTAAAFVPDAEVAVYSSPEELIEKADYYLSRDEERREMALRSFSRTMREHTYPRRVRQLLDAVFA